MSWSNAGIAGVFVAGAALGVVATIRLTRHLLEYLRHERDDHGQSDMS